MMNFKSNALALLLLLLLPTAEFSSAASEEASSVKHNRRHLTNEASSLQSWLSSLITTQSATLDEIGSASSRPHYVRSELVFSEPKRSLRSNAIARNLQAPSEITNSVTEAEGPITLQQLELIQSIIRSLSQVDLPEGVDLNQVNVAVIITDVLQELEIDADGDLSEEEMELIVQEIIAKAAEELGVDIVTSTDTSSPTKSPTLSPVPDPTKEPTLAPFTPTPTKAKMPTLSPASFFSKGAKRGKEQIFERI